MIDGLHPVRVPSTQEEALRDLVRAREDSRGDLMRARHRMSKLLLRHDVRYDATAAAWTTRHRAWLGKIDLGDRGAQVTLLDYLGAIDALIIRRDTLEATNRRAGAQFAVGGHDRALLRTPIRRSQRDRSQPRRSRAPRTIRRAAVAALRDPCSRDRAREGAAARSAKPTDRRQPEACGLLPCAGGARRALRSPGSTRSGWRRRRLRTSPTTGPRRPSCRSRAGRGFHRRSRRPRRRRT